jgi:hypothetical protein
MKPKKILPLLSALVICYLAMGIPYWLIPYSSVSLPDSLYGIGLSLVIAGAAAFGFRGLGFLWTASSFGLVAPAVVATRIVTEIAGDSSTHNLFPFEIGIAVLVGLFAAAFGAATGIVIERLLHLDQNRTEN